MAFNGQGAIAGASAGASVGGPIGAGIGAVLGGFGGGSNKVSGPSISSAYTNVNNSKWTVATGGSNANAGGLPWYAWAVIAVVAIKYIQSQS